MANFTLTWSESISGVSQVDRYEIFRSVDGAGFTQLAEFLVVRDFVGGRTNDLTYQDTGLEAPHSYRYYVQGRPVQGPDSVPSNIVEFTPGGGAQATTPELSASHVSTPNPDVVFSIGSGSNSNGPFNSPPNRPNSYEPGYGSLSFTPSGNSVGSAIPDPVVIAGLTLSVFGFITDSVTGKWIVLVLVGDLPQDAFASLGFADGSGHTYNLLSSAANFNSNFVEAGYSIWAWQPAVNPFAPLNQAITVSGASVDTIHLSWSASTVVGSTIDHYELYRSVDGDPQTLIQSTAALAFIDTDVLLGHDYQYQVLAVPVSGVTSDLSITADIDLRG